MLTTHDKFFYKKYYEEVQKDNHWNFVLLKRKVDIERKTFFENKSSLEFNDDMEFHNIFEKFDTTFNSINPLLK